MLEMLMVLAIFGIITSVVVFNYGKFNNQITLTNLAYEIAMQIREAQASGFGVRGNANKFDGSYGIHFEKGSNTFTIFTDSSPANGICLNCDTCTVGGECQKIISLPRQMTISDIRVVKGSNPPVSKQSVDISFKRPNPDAIIYDGQDSTSVVAEIVIKSQDDQYRKIIVKKFGSVSIQNYVPS